MMHVNHADFESRIQSSRGPIAVSLGDWRFLIDWDREIFGALSSTMIVERIVKPDQGAEATVGFFWLPDDRRLEALARMLLTENVKLVVCSPREDFFSSIDDVLLQELCVPGEFSDSALASAGRLAGFSWLVLSDGNEHDAPYYLFE